MYFLYSRWLQLPLATRTLIAEAFGIIKRGSTEVSDNQVVKDGYLIPEIEQALNIDAIQKYVASENTDMAVLWDMLVAKAEEKEYVPIVATVTTGASDLNVSITEDKSPFCDSCDSRGGAHKKACPKRKKA